MTDDQFWAEEISWIIEDELVAFSAFALGDLDDLVEQGVGAVVSLTEGFPAELVGERRFETLHLPIEDMTPPQMDQIRRFVEFVRRQTSAGRAVGVHCLAGLGRTGTMIACYLVTRGRGADEAIAAVRRARPGSVQTGHQEQAVRRWEMVQSGTSRLTDFL